MTRTLRHAELVDARTLGAIRPVDASTGVTVATRLELRPLEGRVELVRNRTGVWVIAFWSELAGHAASFREPPGAPPQGSRTLRLAITDPTGTYLPRVVSVGLPRDPDPENADQGDSLFRPLEVPLYPAPRRATGPNWAALRVSLSEDGSGDLLGGAFLRVRRNGDVLARGLTDVRGEALLPVVGVPMLTFGEGEDAVVVDEIQVTVQAVFDPDAGSRIPPGEMESGRAPPPPAVDPDALEADADTLPNTAQPVAIAAGRSQSIALTLDLP